jgi:UDP-N-acetylmuramoyl-L-alanyl-D-glutamate--2,6-diaminopimelate ligase
MRLSELINGYEYLPESKIVEMDINSISYDSRKVQDASIFIAVDGVNVDGHKYIESALQCGATAICYQNYSGEMHDGIAWIKVNDSKNALAYFASQFYHNPSKELKLVGVTGTNGKTTIATQLYKSVQNMDHKAGLFSTIKIMIGDKEVKATHTTPDPIVLNSIMRQMVDSGVEYAFMEVSSHGIHQERVAYLDFDGGIFTNITHDHLDYHKTFKEYLNVKKRFFDDLKKEAFALSNNDDKNGLVMLQNTSAKKLTYSLKSQSDYKAKILEKHFNGMLLRIDDNEMWTRLIGGFNAYNLLAIYSTCIELGFDSFDVLMTLSKLESVDGRFEHFTSDRGIVVVVDYAHTPDALENVLSTIADLRSKNETVFTVVGTGGDRDKTKRPIMAKIACENSDLVILTSDNPRTEDPMSIIKDMEAGVEGQYYHKSTSIVDREQAIKSACIQAVEGDIILIAGKGHENYQEINGVRYEFDDLVKAKEILKILKK